MASKENQPKMKILYSAFEAVPFLKLGGLGDVAGTLPMSISAHNCDIRVIIPYHTKLIKKEHLIHQVNRGTYSVDFMGEDIEFELWSVKLRGVEFYLIKNDDFFARKNAYGEKDDLKRFTFFSRAILASIGRMGKFVPQILHLNDWHTALAALYLHEDFEDKLGQYNIKTIFTIHNLQYQGKYKYEKVKDILCLHSRSAVNKVMHKGKVNLMKTGIVASDAVTTPSPNYAKEILTYDYGEGLESVLKRRQKETFGILNGIDYVDFNPAWDTNIKVHFTKDLIERRLGNKLDLQKEFKLKQDPYALLCCVACRFYEQKGISLILEAVPKIIELGGQVLFLGDGDSKYKKKIKQFEQKYKGMVSSHLQFDPLLPHNLYAGADVLLMPSKFEPCGVAQMMAMHYGTLPLVRSTGGLKDTVHNYEPRSLVCNGFVFKNYNLKDFEAALETVAKVWNNDRKNWRRMQKRAMDKDFSWKESGRKYCVLYNALINDKLDTVVEQLDQYAIDHATARAKAAADKAARHAQDRADIARKEMAKANKNEYASIDMAAIDDEQVKTAAAKVNVPKNRKLRRLARKKARIKAKIVVAEKKAALRAAKREAKLAKKLARKNGGKKAAKADKKSAKKVDENIDVKPAVKKALPKEDFVEIAAAEKPEVKKTTAAKKTAAKKTAAKKVPAKKKAPAKKKSSAKKVSAKKKASAKKVPAKKAPAKKKPVAKKASAKKAPVKKPAAKKTAAKKTAAKKAPTKKKAPAKKK